MNTRTAAGVLVLAILTSISSLQAAVIPGRWEKEAGLEAGFPIIVKITSGEQHTVNYVPSKRPRSATRVFLRDLLSDELA